MSEKNSEDFSFVVYFDQRLGATHDMLIFSIFCAKKPKKVKNLLYNLAKKIDCLNLHQNAGQVFYSQIKFGPAFFCTQTLVEIYNTQC